MRVCVCVCVCVCVGELEGVWNEISSRLYPSQEAGNGVNEDVDIEYEEVN